MPAPGDRVFFRAIAYGCDTIGAPPAPGCMNGPVTLVSSPPNDPRLFAVEQSGKIRIIENEVLRGEPFLDVSAEPSFVTGGELGLLGIAFHPAYATNRQVFVFYTATNPDTADLQHPYVSVVARYTASAGDPYVAEPQATIVLSIPDPFDTNQGGMIEFGSDGHLYISTGDGGAMAGPADPFGNAQNPNSLLGKILRIDVDHPSGENQYGIPADNPFASGAAGAPEVWVLGLRNPWRWSFDRATGDMWIGDVGEDLVEELDVLRAGDQAGRNLGWSKYEATSCFDPPCDPSGLTFPVDSRMHADGWTAIVGGQVYRGSCYPALVGRYFYTDTGKAAIASAQLQGDGSVVVGPDGGFATAAPVSLHAAAGGELYQSHLNGNIYQLVAQ